MSGQDKHKEGKTKEIGGERGPLWAGEGLWGRMKSTDREGGEEERRGGLKHKEPPLGIIYTLQCSRLHYIITLHYPGHYGLTPPSISHLLNLDNVLRIQV